ncbi:Ger(x)C family spore germination protein [Caloramator sp. CAR-1]|uniref:Ger(x)C family spore germination protein n=1 Tax=Caloramator sp. CAR-1 TaxID=3062777 RepID=UPI0026E14F5B|nr:Ger(x)C family spore germination protein [Caloramator sp. CAR-1]MDO6355787.1 Ger(x)C family spore germination protein [Caloramator sp. CAR-1]
MKRLIMLLLVPLILTGCWDKTEIEDRMFIYAIAVDKVEDKKSENELKPFYEFQNQNLEVTFLVPNPSKIQGGEADVLEEITVRAQDLPEAVGMIRKKQNREPFFGHEKLLILGEKLLRDEESLKEVLDWIDRDPKKNRSAFVVATKDIKELIGVNPKLEKLLPSYIIGILKNEMVVATMISVSLNEFLGNIKSSGMAMIPIIKRQKDEIAIKNVALIKDFKYIGELDDRYIRGYSLFCNKLKEGKKLFNYKVNIVSYNITSSSAKIKLNEENGRLVFTVDVEMEGDIEDYLINEDILKSDIIRDLQDSVSKQFEIELKEVVRHFQEDIGFDYLNLKSWTKKHKYNLFKKYEKNWDEAFRNAKFNFKVKSYIRRVGVIR